MSLSQLLSNRDFRRLWAGQIVSALGDRIHHLAVFALLFAGQDEGRQIAFFIFCNQLPFLILSPWAGLAADRLGPRRTLILSDISRAAVIALLPFAIGLPSLPVWLYGAAFLVGAGGALFSPARSAFVPALVDRNHLLSANGLIASSGLIAVLAGSSLGGLLVERAGATWAFLLDAATFLISACLLRSIRPRANATAHDPAHDPAVPGEFQGGATPDPANNTIRESLREVAAHPDLRRWMAVSLLFGLFMAASYAGVTALASSAWGLTTSGVGQLLAIGGAGMLAGLLAVTRLPSRCQYPSIAWAALALVGALLILLPAMPSVRSAAVILFIMGFASAFVTTLMETGIQRETAEHHRRRVFGLKSMASSTGFLGTLLFLSFPPSALPLAGQIVLLGAVLSICATAGLLLLALRGAALRALGRRAGRAALYRLNAAWCRFRFRLRVEGAHHLPGTGGAILAANHIGQADGMILGAASPRPIRFVAAAEVFDLPFLGRFVRLAGCIAARRDGRDTRTLRECLRHLRNGDSIGIFPEGGIQGDGNDDPDGRAGVAWMAAMAHVPVVPVHITGTPVGSLPGSLLRSARVHVRIGTPVAPLNLSDCSDPRPALRQQTTQIMNAIRTLSQPPSPNDQATPNCTSPEPALSTRTPTL